METIKIINSTLPVSDNFSFLEYFDTTVSHTKLEFDIPTALIKGIQYLRDFYNIPFQITSAYRPNDSFGFHRLGCAVDTIPSDAQQSLDILAKFKEECLNYKNSALIKGMRSKGVSGFGIESYCIHIDVRPDSDCTLEDDNGKFCIFFWENDGSQYGKSTLVQCKAF
jgi:hypothetical protein